MSYAKKWELQTKFTRSVIYTQGLKFPACAFPDSICASALAKLVVTNITGSGQNS